MSENITTQLNSYNIEELDIYTPNDGGFFNILRQMIGINIYESLFKNEGITLEIILNDAINIPLKIPIIGDEELRIKIINTTGNPNNVNGNAYEFSGTFAINSIEKQTQITSNQQTYLLTATSIWKQDNFRQRVFGLYNGKGPDIVSTIANTFLPNNLGETGTILNPTNIKKDILSPAQEASKTGAADTGITDVESRSDFLSSRINSEVDSSNEMQIFIPNLYPRDAIDFVTKHIISDNDRADFIFYEALGFSTPTEFSGRTKSGQDFQKASPLFFIRSLETLLKAPPALDEGKPLRILIEGAPSGKTGSESIETSTIRAIYSSVVWTIDRNFNKINNIKNGMYGASMVTHDFITKRIGNKDNNKTCTWDYMTQFKKESHLKDKPLTIFTISEFDEFNEQDISQSYTFENKVTVSQKATKLYNSEDNEALFPEKITLSRNSYMQQMNNYTIRIKIIGRFNLYIGQSLLLDIPSPEQIFSEQIEAPIDDIHSGRFLVVAVKHEFTVKEHFMTLDLRSESLNKQVHEKDNTRSFNLT